MKTVTDFKSEKENNKKLTMVTAYDYPSAKLAEQAAIDIILVGDSVGMVVLGYETTVDVTLNDMVHHTRATRRGAQNTFIVSDLPFATYHGSDDVVIQNAVRLIQEGGANAVKVEGNCTHVISLLTEIGIPVVAHLGLTPQSVGVLGGYKVQGKSDSEAEKLIYEAKSVQSAGACMLVLECIPEWLGKHVTEALAIPTIGIGAGKHTTGQVLVYHDILNYGVDRLAKFVKNYANLNEVIVSSLKEFDFEVKNNTFPSKKHTFSPIADEDN